MTSLELQEKKINIFQNIIQLTDNLTKFLNFNKINGSFVVGFEKTKESPYCAPMTSRNTNKITNNFRMVSAITYKC